MLKWYQDTWRREMASRVSAGKADAHELSFMIYAPCHHTEILNDRSLNLTSAV